MKKLIGIIGCGNMGQAIVSQNLKQGARNFIVFEKDKSKQAFLKRTYHVKVAKDIRDLVGRSQTIIIAVKPQDIDAALEDVSSGMLLKKKGNILVISIAAGINTQYIENTLSGKIKVIRAMPNMPARIGKGITALVRGSFAKEKDLKAAEKIFKHLGGVVFIRKEELIDVATALSGSGPAYIFFILSAFLVAAEELGLDKDAANKFIYQTVLGSIELLKENKFDAQTLISQVASKGGTTEAALKVFDERRLKEIIREGVVAAYKRAGELSR